MRSASIWLPNLRDRRRHKNSYEPLFFDVSLSFAQKIEKWRVPPATSVQLVTNVRILSLLAVASRI